MLSQPLAAVVLGEEFSSSGGQIIAVVAIAVGISGLKFFYADFAFQLKRRTILQVWITGIAALLNTALNFVLIPSFGLRGAAWATFITYATATLLSIAGGRRLVRLPIPWPEVAKIGVATLVMSQLILWSPRPASLLALAIVAAIAGTAYVLILLSLNAFKLRESLLEWFRVRKSRTLLGPAAKP
jgi:O-antigen/teichoic acid export membrane protein